MIKTIMPWLRGLDWAKLGLIAVLAASLFGAGWLMGGNRERVQCAEEHAQDLAWLSAYQQGQLDEYNKELKERIRIAQEATRHAAILEGELSVIGEGINEEIVKRQPAASCGPSDREHELYKKAVDRTRSP